MTDPAGWRPGALGAFSREGGSPIHRDSSSLSPGAGFFSSCFCSLDGVSPCQGSGSFCPLPLCSWGGGMGPGKERGGHLCFQCQEKPQGRLCLLQGHEQIHPGRVPLIPCFAPPPHQMLPQFPGSVCSWELLFSLWHTSPVAHIPEGRCGVPSAQGWPQQGQEMRWEPAEGCSMAGQLPWSCW